MCCFGITMNKKQAVTFLILILVVGGAVFFLFGDFWEQSDVFQTGIRTSPEETSTISQNTYSPEVPENVPLTPPKIEAPAAPGSSAMLRVFTISISQKGFDPEQIVVNRGDSLNLNIVSVDGAYDISFPDLDLYQFGEKGQTRKIAFQAQQSGVYAFLCKDHCPANTVIKGSLIVK